MNNAQRLLPPHSIESEQSVLGGLMLDNDRWDDIATIVSADNFYVRPHQLIFNAMHDLLMQGKPVDLITLSEHLEQRGVLEQVGGFAYLAEMSKNTFRSEYRCVCGVRRQLWPSAPAFSVGARYCWSGRGCAYRRGNAD